MTWYENGLKFKCTGCGKCCCGPSGFVWVTPEEILNLAHHLRMSLEDFVWHYIRQVGKRYSLKESIKDQEHSCVFLKDNQCSIYTQRPKQCQTFPWWPRHLTSSSKWEELKPLCEGIEHVDGKLFSQEEIDTIKAEHAQYLERIGPLE